MHNVRHLGVLRPPPRKLVGSTQISALHNSVDVGVRRQEHAATRVRMQIVCVFCTFLTSINISARRSDERRCGEQERQQQEATSHSCASQFVHASRNDDSRLASRLHCLGESLCGGFFAARRFSTSECAACARLGDKGIGGSGRISRWSYFCCSVCSWNA
jgi:hypothetical protein